MKNYCIAPMELKGVTIYEVRITSLKEEIEPHRGAMLVDWKLIIHKYSSVGTAQRDITKCIAPTEQKKLQVKKGRFLS